MPSAGEEDICGKLNLSIVKRELKNILKKKKIS